MKTDRSNQSNIIFLNHNMQMCVNASAARVCFLCQPTAADMRWSVIGFKLQKHESSFKHLLFTASAKMWCGSAKRAHGMVFWGGGFPPKDAENPAEISPTGHKLTRFIWLLWPPDRLISMNSLLFRTFCFGWTVWTKKTQNKKAWLFCLSAAQ